MQGGSIEQVVTSRSVVTLIPTLLPRLPEVRRHRFWSAQRNAAAAVDGARFNVLMLRWIEVIAHLHSVAFEVWHIAPFTDYDRSVFELLVERIEEYSNRGVVSWEHHDEETANEILISSPHIDMVYDADHDRVARLWRIRGYRVPLGGAP